MLLALLEGVCFEIPWSEPAEPWQEAGWCSASRIKCPVFQVSQAPFKASGLPRDLVWVFILNGCPNVAHICISLDYPLQSLRSGAHPVKGAKLKDLKASSFLHSGDMGAGLHAAKPEMPNLWVLGSHGPQSLHQGCGIWIPPTTEQHLPTHCAHIFYSLLWEINVDCLAIYKYLKHG